MPLKPPSLQLRVAARVSRPAGPQVASRRGSAARAFGIVLVMAGCGGSSGSGLFGGDPDAGAEGGESVGGAGGNAGGGTGASGGAGATSSGGASGAAGSASGATGGSGAESGMGGTSGDGGVAGAGGAAGAAAGAGGAAGSMGGAGGGAGAPGGAPSDAVVECRGSPCDVSGGGYCCLSQNTGFGGFGGSAFGGFGGSGFGGSTGGSACNATGPGCGFSGTTARCDGPEDCGSEVCCGSFQSFGGGFYTELTCRPVADCAGAGRRIVCDPTVANPCPNGGSCQATGGLPSGYEVCR